MGAFLTQTPISIVISSMVLVSAFAVRGGVEVVARTAQLFFPFFILSFLVVVILPVSDFEPRNIFPVMEHGVMPSIMGALVPMGWFSEFFIISFFLPFLTDVEKGRKWGMISVVSVMLIMVVTNLAALFMFGGDVVTDVYPLINTARYVSIADFFENLEALVMALWVVGIFIKVTVFYYVSTLCTAQWLQLSDHRPIVLPLGFLIVLLTFWALPNFVELTRYNAGSSVSFLPATQFLIPLLLLLIAVIRK